MVTFCQELRKLSSEGFPSLPPVPDLKKPWGATLCHSGEIYCEANLHMLNLPNMANSPWGLQVRKMVQRIGKRDRLGPLSSHGAAPELNWTWKYLENTTFPEHVCPTDPRTYARNPIVQVRSSAWYVQCIPFSHMTYVHFRHYCYSLLLILWHR